MNEEKKTADELLFEDEKPLFRSRVTQEIIDDNLQKDKV